VGFGDSFVFVVGYLVQVVRYWYANMWAECVSHLDLEFVPMD
jgi:hypothetical protein